MGARGPQPKPTFLRLLENNPGKRAFNPAESKVPSSQPEEVPAPAWFDEERKRVWSEVCQELHAMRGLSRVDYQMLVLYVDTVAEAHRLAKKLQGLPDTVIPVVGPDGKPRGLKSVPYYTQLLAQKNMALRFATHFGMTPSARARIVFLGNAGEGGGAGSKDPFDFED